MKESLRTKILCYSFQKINAFRILSLNVDQLEFFLDFWCLFWMTYNIFFELIEILFLNTFDIVPKKQLKCIKKIFYLNNFLIASQKRRSKFFSANTKIRQNTVKIVLIVFDRKIMIFNCFIFWFLYNFL